MNGIEIGIQKRVSLMGGEIVFFYYDKANKKLFAAEPMVFREVKEGEVAPIALQLDPDKLDYLLRSMQSELKRNGLEINIEAEGELKATKYHLEDMRSMVFRHKPVEEIK